MNSEYQILPKIFLNNRVIGLEIRSQNKSAFDYMSF